jgi:hypothetical protein
VRISSIRWGSLATRPGSRSTHVLAIALILSGVAAGTAACSAQAHPSARAHQSGKSASKGKSTYGQLPSWLPKSKIPVGRVVQASEAHPKLGIEGDTIIVHVGIAQLDVTTVGPQVPEEGKFPVPATTPCAFVVTFAKASAVIDLRDTDFTVLDELGHLHYLRITVGGGLRRGGSQPPSSIRPGQTVTLVMRAVLPTGSGTLRWSPHSPRPVASWDFDVEID